MSAAEPVAPPPRRWPAWLPVALILLAGAVLFLPALRCPLFLDDYFQTSMVEGTYPAPRGPFDLYDFVGDADRATLLDRGLLPWWSHPHITVRFLRPLSSALIYFVDHRLLGNRPLLSHLHSFAWWAAAALAARAVYRRALAPRAALLATIVFALASCHALPLVWLANREALVSLTFGILALGALQRFRERGSPLAVASAALLFSLSLLGGEYAMSFAGYALALALIGPRSTMGAPLVAAPSSAPKPPSKRARRLFGLLSFAVPAGVYLFARARLGYGTDGSGFYHDPFQHPLAFLLRVPRRLLTLLAEGWLTLDPDLLEPSTPAWILVVIVVVGVAVLAVPLRRALANLDEEKRGQAWWLLLGSLLSLFPMLAVMPAPRVLGAAFVGIAATVGLILDRAWFPPLPEPRVGASEWSGLVALGLGFAHLVHGPVTSWVVTRNCRAEAMFFAEHAATLRERVTDPAHQEVVLVRGLGGPVFVLPYALDARGTPPARWRILALGGHVLVLTRDAHTVELVAGRGRSLFPADEGNLFRGEGAPLAVGDVVRVPGMRVTILEVVETGPRRARFELDEALDSPSLVWVADRFDGIQDGTPPPIGFGKPFDPWPPPKETDKAKEPEPEPGEE